jgi:hypothetical protein
MFKEVAVTCHYGHLMSDNNPTLGTDTTKIQLHESRGVRGGAVVEALRYKPEGRGIDSRWCHWNFSLT